MQISTSQLNIQINSLYPNVANSLQLQLLIKQLQQINESFVKVFRNDNFTSELLTRKYAASLYTKVCGFLEQGSIQVRNSRRELLCLMFRSFVINFLNAYVSEELINSQNDWQFIQKLIEKWQQYKRFCHFYVFLFRAAQNHYEQLYKTRKYQAKSNKIDSLTSIFPLPAIAVYSFSVLIYNRYQTDITRIIRTFISEQRQSKLIQRQSLRQLFEIVYSCGLGQLARLNAIKKDNNQNYFQFQPTKKQEIIKQYCNDSKNPDANFFNNILFLVIEDSQHYYKKIFDQKISHLGAYQDFSTAWNILIKQQDIAQSYLFSHTQKNAYLNKIKQIIVVTNLQQRLTRENSLKYCLQKFDPSHDQYISQLKLYFDTVFRAKHLTIKIVQSVIRDYLKEAGALINQKINKRRQHMIQIVNLKKVINRLIDQLMYKDLSICVVRDKCFKQILDSIQASRNLADFADFKVKQCIKNKLAQTQIAENTKDIFLILENLVATDSFLIYYQQLLARRLIQPINQPRIDIEKFLLRKIAEQLGSVTTNAHFYMIKDIQKSQQLSQKFAKKMPLARFKLNSRIISPQFWSDNINNSNLQMMLPESMRIQADHVRQLHFQQQGRYIQWKVQKGFSLFQGTFGREKYRFQSQNIFMLLLFHISQSQNHQILFWQLNQKITKLKQGNNNYVMKCVKVLMDNGLVIKNNQNQQNISQTDQLRINLNFKPAPGFKPNQTVIIKVSPQMMRAMHETTVQKNKILKQRQRVIEAVLVKLLKHSHSTGSNRMTLQNLIKGVREYHHLKNFEISDSIIKQRLQQIIARGYCQRDQKDRKIYLYKA